MSDHTSSAANSRRLLDTSIGRRGLLGAGAAGVLGSTVASRAAARTGKASSVYSPPAILGQATTSLVWATPGNPAELAVYQEIADRFMEANPNVEVTLDREASDFERIVTLIAGGTVPDVIFATINNWPALAVRDIFLSLDDFIERDGYDIDDFYPQIIKPYRYDGERFGEGALYGLPKEIAIRSMYYNQDIYTQAGVEMPSAEEPMSWDQFIDITEQTTIKEGGRTRQFGYIQEMWWGPWMIWSWSAGGEAVDDPYAPTRSTLDTPEALKGFKTYTDFVTVLGVAPDVATRADQGTADVFAAGRGANYNNGRWMVPLFRDSDFGWDVMPMPADVERAQLLTGSIFGISSSTPNADVAWQLLSYVVSQEGQELMTELGLLLPSRRSVAESDLFLASTPPESNRVYLDELEFARPLPLHPNYPEMEQALEDETDLVLTGAKSAEDAMLAMHEAVNAQLQG
jgi:multiple sugar transport system substrate-binding protein